MRPPKGEAVTIPGAVTFVAALLSLPWNLFVTLAAFAISDLAWNAAFVPFGVAGCIHSFWVLAAIGTSAPPKEKSKKLRWLSRWIALGPLAGLVALLAPKSELSFGLFAIGVAGPSMFVAALSSLTAWWLERRET
jgi:hypothetical protein